MASLSHVTAFWKRSGFKSYPANYRPIALLPSLSNAAEAVIHKRLLDNFTENNIISDRQVAISKVTAQSVNFFM